MKQANFVDNKIFKYKKPEESLEHKTTRPEINKEHYW